MGIKQSGMFDVHTGTGCFFFPLREPTYCNNLSRGRLAFLWWEAVNRSSGKTHLVDESYGSPQTFPLREVIGHNEKQVTFFSQMTLRHLYQRATDQSPDHKNVMGERLRKY